MTSPIWMACRADLTFPDREPIHDRLTGPA